MRNAIFISLFLILSFLTAYSANFSPADWLHSDLLKWDQYIFQVAIGPEGRFYAVSGYQDIELYNADQQLIWQYRTGLVDGKDSIKPVILFNQAMRSAMLK